MTRIICKFEIRFATLLQMLYLSLHICQRGAFMQDSRFSFFFLCPCRFIDLFSRVKEDKSGDLYGPRVQYCKINDISTFDCSMTAAAISSLMPLLLAQVYSILENGENQGARIQGGFAISFPSFDKTIPRMFLEPSFVGFGIF